MTNPSAFFKRNPGAAKVGLLFPHAGVQARKNNNYSPITAQVANVSIAANRRLVRKLGPRLRQLALDAIAQVKEPMDPEFNGNSYGKDPYGENPDTPEKKVAHHAVKAAQKVSDIGGEPNPDVNEICQHLEAAMHAAKKSLQSHQIIPHLQQLHQHLSGGAEPEEGGQDSDDWDRKF
jgi:hypothetical protein